MVHQTMNKTLTVGQLLKFGLVAALAYFAYSEHQQANAARMEAGWVRQLNDSTVAMTAAKEIENRKQLAALTDAAKALRGTLVAAVSFQTKADTAVRPLQEVISSTVEPDGTRSAELVDTTEQGIELRIQAEAPPAPANLRLGYSVTIPPFTPSVGFVRTGKTYAAVVSWAGQQTTIDNAFYVPEGKALPPKWRLLSITTTGGAHSPLLRKPDWGLSVDRRVTPSLRLAATAMTSTIPDRRGVTLTLTKTWWER